jgi:hypothetical protein
VGGDRQGDAAAEGEAAQVDRAGEIEGGEEGGEVVDVAGGARRR